MGIVFYRDWTPGAFRDPTYNPQGAQPQLESWQSNVPKPLPFQPVSFYDNRASWPDFYLANIQRGGYTTDELYPYPYAQNTAWYAPPQPIREDLFNQLAVRSQHRPVAGQAPTRGIYTGTTDITDL